MQKAKLFLILGITLLTSFLVNSIGYGKLNDQRIIAIAAGKSHSLALRIDGTVWAWGNNEDGCLGDGTTTKRNKPVQVKSLNNVKAIAAGYSHSIALKNDGTVWAWGNCERLGNNSKKNSTVPVQVIGLKNIVSIDANFDNSIAVKDDGSVWTWGDNVKNQLGDPEKYGENPIQVPGIKNVKKAICGLAFCLALKTDGTIWAWGWNTDTILGVGSKEETIIKPAKVNNIDNVKDVCGSAGRITALKSNGTVWKWGSDDGVQQVKALSNIIKINQGYAHGIAIGNDNKIWTWGYNDKGQLGDGTNKDSDNPQQIQGLSYIISVAGGELHSVALSKDGTVWAWGANDKGQLGDGTFTNKSKPVKVLFKLPPTNNPVANNNNVITDIANWNHPVKAAFKKYGFTITKVEFTQNNKYPIFYVKDNPNCTLDNDTFLEMVASKNGYWNFKIVSSTRYIEVTCDKTQKTITGKNLGIGF